MSDLIDRGRMTTADMSKVMADAEALHTLFNMFGRGRVDENEFIVIYLSGRLPEYIKKVVIGEERKMGSELCKTCIHTKVCMKDKNLVGDVFVMGHPMMFDNDKLYEEYKERERQGFPCEDYMPVAEPKRGKWEEKSTFDVDENGDQIIQEWQSARCSVCGRYHTTPYMYYFDVYNFCPNCGADMRGEEDETN